MRLHRKTRSTFKTLQKLAKKSKVELGGHIDRADDVGFKLVGGFATKNKFLPHTDEIVERKTRFHTHPDRKFPTPPSDRDFVQCCEDYRNGAPPYHVVVCPGSTFIMTVPKHIKRMIDSGKDYRPMLKGRQRRCGNFTCVMATNQTRSVWNVF